MQQRLDHLLEIGAVGGIDLGGDLQRDADRLGDGDRLHRSLLWRDAAQEGQIVAVAGAEAVDVGLQAVQHGACPVGSGQGAPLVIRDRDQRELRPAPINIAQALEVQAAVQGGERPLRIVLEEREVDHVGVEVDDVEVVRAPAHLVQHGHVRGEVRLQRGRIQPDGLIAHGHQLGLGFRVGAGEQGDLVAELDQGVAQVSDDTLGAAVELGGDRLVQRRHLRDLHSIYPLRGTWTPPFPQG